MEKLGSWDKPKGLPPEEEDEGEDSPRKCGSNSGLEGEECNLGWGSSGWLGQSS